MADPVQLGTYAEKLRALEDRLERLETSGGNGGGTSDGMEPRLAKLEAQMEAVRADLARLALLPADVASIKERLTHLPTRHEAKNDIKAAVDRAGTRTQRTILILGSVIAMAFPFLTNLPKLLH